MSAEIVIDIALVDGFPKPAVRCTTCGDRIRNGQRANVVWEPETGNARVVHKGPPCDPGDWGWEDLSCIIGYLLVALGLEDALGDALERGFRPLDDFREAA